MTGLVVGVCHNGGSGNHPGEAAALENSCKNLHGDADGLHPLTIDIDNLISKLEQSRRLQALSSSLDTSTPTAPHARRSPPRARRRAWQTKARYQRTRCPERLRPKQIEALFETDNFARSIGLPLNAFVSVSWKNTRQGTEAIPRRFQEGTKAMGQWMRRQNCPAAWIFVHENPGNSESNFHMLVHVPPGRLEAFKSIAPNWFDALVRNGPRDRCLQYMVKGTDLVTARRYGAIARNQGTVDFKRCGWTESLGVTARKRHRELKKPG